MYNLHMGVVYIWLNISKVEIKLWFQPGSRSLKLCYWFLSYDQVHPQADRSKKLPLKGLLMRNVWWKPWFTELSVFDPISFLIIFWSEAKWNFAYLSEDFCDYEFLIYRWDWLWNYLFFACSTVYGPFNLDFKEAPLLLLCILLYVNTSSPALISSFFLFFKFLS